MKKAWSFLISPTARRYETAVVLAIYELIRAGFGHP